MTPPDSSALIRVKPSHLHFNGIMQVITLHLEDSTLTRFASWPQRTKDASLLWRAAAQAVKEEGLSDGRVMGRWQNASFAATVK